MKQLLLFLMIVSSSLACKTTPPEATEEKRSTTAESKSKLKSSLIVKKENAWVRDYPSNGEVIARLHTGTECLVLQKGERETINGSTDYWYKVKCDNVEGWIFGSQTSLKEHPKKYSIPDEVSIDTCIGSSMCPEFNCLVEEFFPIGWSDNNQYFSWINQAENEAIGGYDFTIYIQNMVNDSLVWIWSFKEHELNNWDEKSSYDLERVWQENEKNICKKLHQYDISQLGTRMKVKPLPTAVDGVTYSVQIDKQLRKNEAFGNEEIGYETVTLHAEGIGSKKVYEKEYGAWGIQNTAIIGLITSHNKERTAIIKVNEKRGYEGPPNILTVQLIGSHLKEGFR